MVGDDLETTVIPGGGGQKTLTSLRGRGGWLGSSSVCQQADFTGISAVTPPPSCHRRTGQWCQTRGQSCPALESSSSPEKPQAIGSPPLQPEGIMALISLSIFDILFVLEILLFPSSVSPHPWSEDEAAKESAAGEPPLGPLVAGWPAPMPPPCGLSRASGPSTRVMGQSRGEVPPPTYMPLWRNKVLQTLPCVPNSRTPAS